MGNNLQALRTAKALTKQLTGDDSYVTANSSRDLEIERQNGHSSIRLSMSPESPDSVTQGQTSTQERHKTKELMTSRSNAMSGQPEGLNSLIAANNKHVTNSFVYYIPQSNVPQTQDGRFEEGINNCQHRKETSMTQVQSEKTTTPKAPTRSTSSKPVVVDLTLDDSDEEEQESNSSTQIDNSPTNTFPKILAAYSLNAGNSPFPASDLCTLLSQKAKENQVKPNETVVDTSTLNRTKPRELVVDSSTLNKTKLTNGLVFHNRPKTYNFDISDQRASLTNGILNNSSDSHRNSTSQALSSYTSSMVGYKNGVMNDVTNSTNQVRTCVANYKNDIINDVTNQTDQSRSSDVSDMTNNENDVMSDVTKTRNAVAYEYRPLLFSSWSKTTERHSDTETSSSDSGDNVVITKVVTPAERVGDRSPRKHSRKEPIKVRQLYFDQEVGDNETTNPVAQDVSSKKTTMSSTSAQQSTRKRSRVDDVLKGVESEQRSKWSVDKSSQQIPARLSPNNMHREAKIKTLRNLLAKQEMAVQKMRTKDNGSPSFVPSDRVLVVEIPDLKSELQLPKEGKHSFRISSQTITLSPNDNDSHRRRPRKRDPRKITRQEERYPSYVEAKGLSRLHDNDDDVAANKRFKGKSRGKSRGRCSPKPNKPIPVVLKDPWHRELEKVEAVLTTSDRLMDKTTFMLFLGLKQV